MGTLNRMGIVAFCSLAAVSAFATLPTFAWNAPILFGTLNQSSRLLKQDALGNSYVASTTLSNTLAETIFLTKIDPNGKVSWTKVFGSKFLMSPSGLAADSNGNVYLQVTKLATGTSNNEVDLYAFKPTGAITFTKVVTNTGDLSGLGISVDPSNNVCSAISASAGGPPYADIFIGTCFSPAGAVVGTFADPQMTPSACTFDATGAFLVTGQPRLAADPSHSAAFARYADQTVARTLFKSQLGFKTAPSTQTSFIYRALPDQLHPGLFFLASTQWVTVGTANPTYATKVSFNTATGVAAWTTPVIATNPYYMVAGGPNNLQVFGFNSAPATGTTYYAIRAGHIQFSQPNGNYLAVAPETNGNTYYAQSQNANIKIGELDSNGNQMGPTSVVPNTTLRPFGSTVTAPSGCMFDFEPIAQYGNNFSLLAACDVDLSGSTYGPNIAMFRLGAVFSSIQATNLNSSQQIPSGHDLNIEVDANQVADKPISVLLSSPGGIITFDNPVVVIPKGSQKITFKAHTRTTSSYISFEIDGIGSGVERKLFGEVKHPVLSNIQVPIFGSQAGIFVSCDILGKAPYPGTLISVSTSDPKTIPSTSFYIASGSEVGSTTLAVKQFSGPDRVVTITFQDTYGNKMSNTVRVNGTK